MTLPDVPDAFRWAHEAWGVALRCRPLELLAPHLFSTRQLALSAPETDRALSTSLGVRSLVMLSQIHGADVVVAHDASAPPDRSTQGDVLVSRAGGLALGVRSADCVPLLIADATTGAVAAVHAGWRGTAAGAAGAAVRALSRELGSRPADLVAAIGPCIGACCYDVGSELVNAFAAAGHERSLIDRWFLAPPPPRGSGRRRPLRLDLATANRDQLVIAGVDPAHIHQSGLCTADHLDLLTSYRREKRHAGRLVAAIAVSPFSPTCQV